MLARSKEIMCIFFIDMAIFHWLPCHVSVIELHTLISLLGLNFSCYRHFYIILSAQ